MPNSQKEKYFQSFLPQRYFSITTKIICLSIAYLGPPRSFQSFLTKILFWRCFSSTCRMGVDLIEISNRKGF
uniref:Uncharacterized protein n=1 Tax=Meloidogyne enterolobii TaxID=390850 RepID=A0A6V7U6R6_MELEN|nr:unnamed protein product [Meloidogyne enterolobii]